MLRRLTQTKCRDLILGLALLSIGAALICYPTQSMEAGQQGLQLCFNVIIPSLFPFFVLSSLVVELGMARYLGRAVERLMWPLFRVGGAGACALVLGFVGGYPIGARTAINLYEKGLCTKTETQRMLAFCNNSGPAFIFGVVGAGVFGSSAIGLLLYLAHIAASLCVGILFRFYGGESPRTISRSSTPQFQAARLSTAFTASVRNSFASIWNICAFVVFFTVVIRLLFLCGAMTLAASLLSVLLSPFGFDPASAQHLLIGLLEVSSGVTSLTGEGAPAGQVSMAAFMLGWAGLSVHCQVLSFLSDTALSPGTYLAGKALHGILSAVFTLGPARLFPLSSPVSGYLTQQIEVFSVLDANHTLILSVVAAWLLWVFFLCLSAYAVSRKKSGGKRPRHAV